MKIGRHIKHIVLWVMLATVAVAYTGKALHTHADSYYDALRATKSAASNGMSDDCPICHFNLVLFAAGSQAVMGFYALLMLVFFAVVPLLRSKEIVANSSLRAPPVVL